MKDKTFTLEGKQNPQVRASHLDDIYPERISKGVAPILRSFEEVQLSSSISPFLQPAFHHLLSPTPAVISPSAKLNGFISLL